MLLTLRNSKKLYTFKPFLIDKFEFAVNGYCYFRIKRGL